MYSRISRNAAVAGAMVFAAASTHCAGVPTSTAVCILAPPPGQQGPGSGVVSLTQQRIPGTKTPVVIRVRVSGLAPNSVHGFHIHQLGDLQQGCISAGGHFNPSRKNHGGPLDEERHAGDLGNVVADGQGVVDATIIDSLLSLDPASTSSIIGRSAVLHADPDDLGKGGHADSLTTGHAGARISCGVIGLGADIEEVPKA